MTRIDYRLYLVTDDPSRYVGDWLDNVVAAVEGGVTCVQYRDTENADRVQYARIRRLQDALKPRGVPVIVNNDAELAAAVKAEGVHVGQGDLSPVAVRTIVGPDVEIGLSITCAEDLRRFQSDAALISAVSCLGIGPVYDATKTKRDAAAAMGPAGLREILAVLSPGRQPQTSNVKPQTTSLPSVAIGGITLARASEVLATGGGGLAVVSAFSRSSDPYTVAQSFRNHLSIREDS